MSLHCYILSCSDAKALQMCSLWKIQIETPSPNKDSVIKKYVDKTIGRSTNEDDVICSKCRSAYKRSVRDSHDTEGSDDDFVVVDSAACKNDMISPKNIHLNILSTQTSHKYCIVIKKKANSRVRLSVIPLKARTQAFIGRIQLKQCYWVVLHM